MNDAILIVASLALASWAAWSIFRSTGSNAFFWPTLIIKVIAGIAVGCLYFYYYGSGDTLQFWKDACVVADNIKSDPVNGLRFLWGDFSEEAIPGLLNDRPRSIFFVKFAALLALLLAGNYWLMSAAFSLFSFLCAWYFFIKINRTFPDSTAAAALAVLFFPSVVFWSSGLIKESAGLGALFIIAGGFLSLYKQEKLRLWEWLAVLFSFWIGWNLKYYWLGIFIPVIVTTLAVFMLTKSRPSTARYEILIWVALFIMLLFVATSIHPNFYPSRFVDVVWQSNREFMALSDTGKAIQYYQLEPTFASLLLNAPWALFSGMFRPLPFEATTVLAVVSSLENLLLLVLVIMALPKLRNIFRAQHRLLTLASLIYSMLMAVFLALSTPNYGSLARYKIGFLPFLVFAVLYRHPWMDKVVTWWKKKQGIS